MPVRDWVTTAIERLRSKDGTSVMIAAGVIAGVALGSATAAYFTLALSPEGSSRRRWRTYITLRWPRTHFWLTKYDSFFDIGPASSPNREGVLQFRKFYEDLMDQVEQPSVDVVMSDMSCPTRDGFDMPMRIIRPAKPPSGPLPILYYLHGGGWVIGSPDTHRLIGMTAANDTPCIVVMPDYRMAPEHVFPVPIQDCVDGLRWVSKHARKLGGDPDRLVVGGDSAGGHLTLCVTMANRDAPLLQHVPVCGQALIYPAVDYRWDDASMRKVRGFPLTAESMRWMWDVFIGDSEAMADDPRLSPLRGNLADLPPVWLLTCQWDVLLSQDLELLEKLHEAGTPATHTHFKRATHGFLCYTTIGSGRRAMKDLLEFVRDVTAKVI